MALALLFAFALAGAEPPTTAQTPAADPGATHAPQADGSVAEKIPTREEMEDAIPEGAPKDDYEFVAWCHGALAGQIELDPIVEKDMDAIEGKEKAAKRKADDAEIAKEHKRYLGLYEKALTAAEKASPVAIHQRGVDAELQGYKIWSGTKNKQPVWRMVDWGNWEVPPRCEKAAKRLYDQASLLGVALKSETDPTAAAATTAQPPVDGDTGETGPAVHNADPMAPDANAPPDPKPADGSLRGPK